MAILRDPRFASKAFGLREEILREIPRQKFMFWVRFVMANDEQTTDANDLSRWNKGISYRVKSVERPKVSIKSETLNQYNKKRVVQSGVDYNPITIKFYDTISDSVLNMFQKYISFYYGDFTKENVDWVHDQTSEEMNMGNGYWGYYNTQTDTNSSYYFERLEIYTFGGGVWNTWHLIHPKIVDFSPDDLDYTDVGTPSEISMSLAYEGIVWPDSRAFEPSEDGNETSDPFAEMMSLDQGENQQYDYQSTLGSDEDDLSFDDENELFEQRNALIRQERSQFNQYKPFLNTTIELPVVETIRPNTTLDFGTNIVSKIPEQIINTLVGSVTGSIGSVGTLLNSLTNGVANIGGSITSGISSFIGSIFGTGEILPDVLQGLETMATEVEYTSFKNVLSIIQNDVKSVQNNKIDSNYEEKINDILYFVTVYTNTNLSNAPKSQIVSILVDFYKKLNDINTIIENNKKRKTTNNYDMEIAKLRKIGIRDKNISEIIADNNIKNNRQTVSIDRNLISVVNNKKTKQNQIGFKKSNENLNSNNMQKLINLKKQSSYKRNSYED